MRSDLVVQSAPDIRHFTPLTRTTGARRGHLTLIISTGCHRLLFELLTAGGVQIERNENQPESLGQSVSRRSNILSQTGLKIQVCGKEAGILTATALPREQGCLTASQRVPPYRRKSAMLLSTAVNGE
ncbi:hypothetical protein SKAU_G00013200 [Synaphobranchus kaupii]|uniref:Uncharacterized protein n=1 Tax=Synaphobranchus kaupii TaxID=118154 RepID=A0A9Q1GAN6_SYNKA|nr:hypothetical protein SKAU_G00013200 [Synaphobranchus kaupii]